MKTGSKLSEGEIQLYTLSTLLVTVNFLLLNNPLSCYDSDAFLHLRTGSLLTV